MPRDSPEKNTPRRLFGNSAGYSADSVVACVLPKKIQEVNEMANVKMIAPQTFQPEHMRVAAYCRVSSDSRISCILRRPDPQLHGGDRPA